MTFLPLSETIYTERSLSHMLLTQNMTSFLGIQSAIMQNTKYMRTFLTKLNISIFWQFSFLTDLVTLKWDLYDGENRTYENSTETLNFQASIYKIVCYLMRETENKTFYCKIYLLASIFCWPQIRGSPLVWISLVCVQSIGL